MAEFPPGWDEERVQRVLGHYEGQAEDEAAFKTTGQTVMVVLSDLVPAVRALIARHT